MKKMWIFFAVLIMSVAEVSVSAQEFLIKYKEGTVPPANSGAVLVNESLNLYIVSSQEQAELLADDENAEYIEENSDISLIEDLPVLNLMQVPTDDLYAQQWQLQMVKAQAAWDLETYGNDVRIAVIDSGCAASDELSPSIIGGYNYIDKNNDYSDTMGHGTNVSSIIAAAHDGKGIAGIAPKAKLVQLKCFGANGGSVKNAVNAITDAVDVYNCKILNLSFGMTTFSQSLDDALKHAVSKGAIPIAAVGNEYSDVLNYPAASDYAIGVGSVDSQKSQSLFSQYNDSVFAVASGEVVLGVNVKGSGYSYFNGTSQAAPQVAAAAAIALSINDKIDFNDFKTLLSSSCEDLGDEGYDHYFGHGLLNIEEMINNLMKKVPFYVSPVYETDGKKCVILKSNTEKPYRVRGIWAAYGEDETLINTKVTAPLIAGGAKIAITFDAKDAAFSKFMLWTTMNEMAPITKARIAD